MPIALATPAVTDVPPHCGGVEKINICGEAYGAWGGVGSHLRGLPRPRPRRRQPPRCCRAGAAARAAARPGWPHLFWRTGAPAAAAARDGVSHRIAGGRNRGACRPDSADVRHRSCPSTQAFEMLKCRDPAHINSQLAPRIAPTSSLLDSDTLHQAQCEQPVGHACPRWTRATGFAAPAAGRGSHRADTQLMAWPSAVQSSFTGHGTMARLGLSQETVC